MSKFADALNKIQKQNRKAPSPSGKPIFINPVDTHLRSRSGADRLRTFLRILQPLLMLGGLGCLVMIFLYGVQEGKKISDAEKQHAAAVAAAEQAAAEAKAEAEARAREEALQAAAALSAGEEIAGKAADLPAAAASAGTAAPAALVQAAAVQPSSAPAAENTPGGRYTIQLITYSTPERAAEQVGKLKEAGYQPFVIEAGFYYQINVNRFATAADARKFLSDHLSKLADYPGAYVRQVPEGMA